MRVAVVGVSPKASQTQIGARGASREPISPVSIAGNRREPRANSTMQMGK
jgi:hypothetical protein